MDLEGLLVMELTRQASLEHSSSEACGLKPSSFKVQDLMLELELNTILRSSGNYNNSDIEWAWKMLIGNIWSYMADSKSVIVCDSNLLFQTRFSKMSMDL
jgi:hypothetical protein